MFADLHLHTSFSDGTFSPEELVTEARRVGLTTIALTDHDTLDGIDRTAAACETLGIEFIPGTELTAEWHGREIHLLGYFPDPASPKLRAKVATFQQARRDRIHEMVKKLNHLNVPIHAEWVFDLANCRSPGRPHVARALVRHGVCKTLNEAFDRFLKVNRPAWVPKLRISAEEAIGLIHDAGGLAVLAHPGINRHDEAIPHLVDADLDGLECFHSKHSAPATERYLTLAQQHRLLITGGSDCHGYSKSKPLIGTVRLSLPYLEPFRAEWAKARGQAMIGPDPSCS